MAPTTAGSRPHDAADVVNAWEICEVGVFEVFLRLKARRRERREARVMATELRPIYVCGCWPLDPMFAQSPTTGDRRFVCVVCNQKPRFDGWRPLEETKAVPPDPGYPSWTDEA